MCSKQSFHILIGKYIGKYVQNLPVSKSMKYEHELIPSCDLNITGSPSTAANSTKRYHIIQFEQSKFHPI